MAGDYNLGYVFNPNWSSSATTSNIVYGNTTWTPDGGLGKLVTDWSEPSMTKAKQSPLDWLHAAVDRYVELGTLRE